MAEKIFERRVGPIVTAVFREQAATEQSWFDNFPVKVDTNMVAIGGGALGASAPQGALLTASYPNDARTAWLLSSKDHGAPNPHRLTGFAIGMEVVGMGRNQFRDSHLQVGRVTSTRTAHPEATAHVPEPFKVISGGFKVDWQPGQGSLATASFPQIPPGGGDVVTGWTARSKDHSFSSPATIDAFAIGITLPWYFSRKFPTATSGTTAHPSASVALDNDHVLTGIGAEARFNGAGSLLWRLEPTAGGNTPGVTASSKDHQVPSPGTIQAWAIGIRAAQ